METPHLPIALETEMLLQQHGGPLSVPGEKGEYVVMRADVYDAMLGIEADDEAETLASVRRGLADMEAGRMRDLDEVFGDLDSEQ
jgi:PHD/YefM family antitoxin component YafN of YafNO toxin-antitoxin module